MLRQYYLLLACSIFKHETFGILLTKVQFLPVSQKNIIQQECGKVYYFQNIPAKEDVEEVKEFAPDNTEGFTLDGGFLRPKLSVLLVGLLSEFSATFVSVDSCKVPPRNSKSSSNKSLIMFLYSFIYSNHCFLYK